MSTGINIPEYDVSQFNFLFKEVVEANFDYVRIKGEISELKNAASGHIYLTLKDNNSVLNATIWNQKKHYLQIIPELGMEVIVTGKVSTFAKSISTYSINIDKLELAGEGALLKLIEDRKKRLQEKGIFNDEHKKNIPYLPSKIGVITSPTGSVIHDIINRIKDRFPTSIYIWPVSVQGVKAANNIIEAIEGFNSEIYKLNPEVIIIARGGGSTEDLMPFNDEGLALAVYNSKIPIISAIGHETDFTIIDYVSDLRASTPTAAAEKAVPVNLELQQLISILESRLNTFLENKINNSRTELSGLSRFIKSPDFIIKAYKEKFNKTNLSISKRLIAIYDKKYALLNQYIKMLRSPESIIDSKKENLKKLFKIFNKRNNEINLSRNIELSKYTRLLESNSLHKNLKKGYSIIRKSKKIINKSNLIKEQDLINIQFVDKSINVKLKKIN